MPSVNIRENDNTTSGLTGLSEDYAVLIPVSAATTASGYPKYVTKADITALGTGTAGAKQAKLLFELGAPVLVIPFGDDTKPTPSSYEDRNKYNFRFMIKGDGTGSGSTGWTDENMIKACAERGDAIALIASQLTSGAGTTQRVDYKGVSWGVPEANENYAASFIGGVKLGEDTTNYNATIVFLDCFYTFVKTYPEWFAFSGFQRGKPTNTFVATNYYSDSQIAGYQPRVPSTDTYSANVFTEIRPAGDIIWGNRTAAEVEATKDLTAKHFLNIRNLCCTIKKVAYRAAKKYTFEPNTDVLWANFTGDIIPTLEQMRANQGIRGYKIIKEETGVKGLIIATIKIAPIEAVEDFEITLDLQNSVE